MTSSNAGHMLGSTNVLIDAIENGQRTRLLFSGDVGRKNLPIIRDPDPAPAADYLIMESTYGDRLHPPAGDVKQKIAGIVKRVTARGGHIIVPAFAVERTQQLVLCCTNSSTPSRSPSFPSTSTARSPSPSPASFASTPKSGTKTAAFTAKGEDPFDWNRLRYTQTVQESKALNDLRVPYIVMSASGCARPAASCTT